MAEKVLCEEAVPSLGVVVVMRVEVFDDEELDTEVAITGGFTIAAARRGDFVKRFGDLIKEFRV